MSDFLILKSRNQGLLFQGHHPYPMVLFNIYSLGVNMLWAISVAYLPYSPGLLLPCYPLFPNMETAGPQHWQSPKVAITHSNEVPWYLSSLPPDTPSLPVLIYKHLCIFSTTLPRLGEAPLCDEIIRETVTFPVVRLRVSTAWKNTPFFSGELLCQGARNAAEGRSPGPKAASKEWSEMWKRINNHSSK